jgi:hypothetical protein
LSITEPEEYIQEEAYHFQIKLQAIPLAENDISISDYLNESLPNLGYQIQKVGTLLTNENLKREILNYL